MMLNTMKVGNEIVQADRSTRPFRNVQMKLLTGYFSIPLINIKQYMSSILYSFIFERILSSRDLHIWKKKVSIKAFSYFAVV